MMKTKKLAKVVMGILIALFFLECQSYRVIQSDENSAAIQGHRKRTETEAHMVALEGAKEHFKGAEIVETKEPDCDEELRGKARVENNSSASVRLKSYYRCIVFVKKK